ncbi:MAG TPA: ABC transporter permease [Phycisphaerae bacterium]|jgi:putative ABC transport system permease protein|nr:ABC transporter permease [Phycisphaerae bacterium]
MNLYETFQIAVRDLAMHKFRSALATLGIIFGVASVEAMVSISEGARSEAMQRITVLGVDNIMIRSQKPSDVAQGNSQGERRSILQYGLLRRDLEHVRLGIRTRYAVGSRNMRTKLYTTNGRELDVTVIATEPEYVDLTRSQIQRGRFITDMDQKTYAQVCVLGIQAAQKVFGFSDPMGKTIKVAEYYYRVVGILDNAAAVKDAGGDDINNQIFIPLATARVQQGDLSQQRSSGQNETTSVELDAIGLQLTDEAEIPAVAARLENYFEQTHKLKDYQFLVPYELLRQKAATQRIFTIVMASIAGLSLLIGGIGIMNIMLANVYDRRKEIGTRRALGARRADIVWQFLMESATLTTLGGLVGVGLGYVLARVISLYAEWPTIISWPAIGLGLAISSIVGIIFGLWPARQAARTNPIEALRAG